MTENTKALGFAATQTEKDLVVHGVPIFCACTRGDLVFDEAWVAAAVNTAMRKQREGYFAPLHVRHHGDGADVTAAGHFQVTGTAQIVLGGISRTAIIADLTFTSPEAARDVLTMRLPYRSVEIFDAEATPSIDSLALLDHEAPYLELPMLKVGEISAEPAKPVNERIESRPLFGDAGSVLVFRRNGRAITSTMNTSEPETMTTQINTAGVLPARRATKFAETAPDEKESKMAEEKSEDESAKMAEEEASASIEAIVEAITAGTISIADMGKIQAAVQSQLAEAAAGDEEPAPAEAPDVMQATPKREVSEVAQLQAQIDVLTAGAALRDAGDLRKRGVDAAMLKLQGLPLGADLKAKLQKFHAAHGPKAFGDYVESLAQNTAVLLRGGSGSAAAFAEQQRNVPEVAAAYTGKGADAVEKAATFSREYDQLKGLGIRSNRETYVRTNMTRIGVILDGSTR